MHPPLYVNRHPHCKDVIEALVLCHEEHPFSKFVGACNDQKFALDRCFREEKKINRAKNFEKARDERERLAERLGKNADGRIPGFGVKRHHEEPAAAAAS